jgi:ParB/RepB/Spo0J family partition protein
MSTTTTPTASAGELRLALDEIAVRDNVRELDLEHVDNLAQSIALRGVLVPLIVRATDNSGWELVAGYHGIAACRQLGVEDVPVVVREREGSSADRAAENVTRKQLTPLEEARAVQAMLDEGYTADGVAQALGWSRQLVTVRAKILRLPAGQQLVGSGEIPVSAIDTLLAIGAVSPVIMGALCEAIAAQQLAGSQLVSSPGWAIGQVLRDAGKDVFGAYLNQVHHGDLTALRLGKKTDALVAEAEQLHKQVDRYAYGPPALRFSEADVDPARAAGVLIELDRSTPDHLRPAAVARAVQAGDRPHRRGPACARRRQGQGQAWRRGVAGAHAARAA